MRSNKIILINFLPSIDSSYSNKGCIYPSTATLLIGTVLRNNGYEVELIDGAYHEDYLRILEEAIKRDKDRILYVGMSVMITQIPMALEASKLIKGIGRDIKVIWGGAHTTLFPEQTLKDEHVDVVAINEGALTALRLADCLKKNRSLKSINGIGFKENGKAVFTQACELEAIDEIPHFDFSLINVEKYLNPSSLSVYQREFPLVKDTIKIMPILTGLGCPFKCEFCINVILQRRYRYRSATSIIEEIKRLQTNYGANTFFFLDEDFFINKKRVLEFVSLAEDEKLKFNFRVWCRVDHFKKDYISIELLERLEKIGYVSFVMGGESGDIETLTDLKKGITPEQIINSLKILSKTKHYPRYSFMVGLENESIEQIKNTYRFCMEMKKINPDVDIAGPFIFRLYPGSPIYNRIKEKYDMDVPDTLESWSMHVRNDGNSYYMPWAPQKFQALLKNVDALYFYSQYAFNFNVYRASGLKGIMELLFSKTSQVRLKWFYFGVPIEYAIFNFYKKLKNYMRN